MCLKSTQNLLLMWLMLMHGYQLINYFNKAPLFSFTPDLAMCFVKKHMLYDQ